ncbi:MAG: V-type ATP synthase subunit A, partial [Clostridia bacterium]|nr:V-type ATP synthase subunit A [Clostridia bacterium]
EWMIARNRMMLLLQEEAELDEIVKLVGVDALSAPDRIKLEAARSIREDYLHQDAFHEVDTFTSLDKQLLMMKLVLAFYDKATEALKNGVKLSALFALPVREQIGRFKYTPEQDAQKLFDEIIHNLDVQIEQAEVKED